MTIIETNRSNRNEGVGDTCGDPNEVQRKLVKLLGRLLAQRWWAEYQRATLDPASPEPNVGLNTSD